MSVVLPSHRLLLDPTPFHSFISSPTTSIHRWLIICCCQTAISTQQPSKHGQPPAVVLTRFGKGLIPLQQTPYVPELGQSCAARVMRKAKAIAPQLEHAIGYEYEALPLSIQYVCSIRC
jgi:hypothetical protein